MKTKTHTEVSIFEEPNLNLWIYSVYIYKEDHNGSQPMRLLETYTYGRFSILVYKSKYLIT